jgi:hypothetical protein
LEAAQVKIKIIIWFFNVLALVKLIDAIAKIKRAPASETLASLSLVLFLSVLGVSLVSVRYRMPIKQIAGRESVPEWSQTHKTCSGMAIVLFFVSVALKLSGH